MGVLTRLLERRAHPENPTTKISNPATWFTEWATGGAKSASGASVTPATAMRVTAVYACIRVLAETIASLPLILYERLEPRGKQRAPAHPLYRLVHDRPNPEMTAVTFRETLMGHVAGWGNGYAEIERDNAGRPIALWPLPPDRTRAERVDGVKRYVTRVDGRDIPLTADRVLHIPGLGYDGLTGYSPIQQAREAIGLAIAAESFGASFFGNGSRPGGVLEHPKKLDPEAHLRLKDSWSAQHGGLTNQQRTAILEEGMTWKSIGVPPEEAQFIETRKFQVAEIARLYRVPLHLIGDLERSTNNNIEQQSIEFVVHTIRPWLVRWEQALNRALLSDAESERYFFEFLVDGLLRGDLKSRYDAYAVGRNWGWLSANEIRDFENMNPQPAEVGDKYLVPMNTAPAGGPPLPPKDSAPPKAPPARSADGRAAARQRLGRAYEQLLRQVAEQSLRREVNAARRALRKSNGGRDGVALRTWLDEFYEAQPDFLARAFAPTLVAFAESIYAEIADELGAADEVPPSVRAFAENYAAGLATREAKASADTLRALLRDADADHLEASVELALGAWEESRAAALAEREAQRAAAAIGAMALDLARLTTTQEAA